MNSITVKKTVLRLLPVGACTALMLAASSAGGASWTHDYGDNLWPNGRSNIDPPPNAPPEVANSAEFLGRTNELGAAYDPADAYARIVIDPYSNYHNLSGAEIVAKDFDCYPGEIYRMTAWVKLSSGQRAELAIYSYNYVGGKWATAVSPPVTAVNGWYQVEVWYEVPLYSGGPLTVGFALRVFTNGIEDGKAYFDSIIARRFVRYVPVGTILPFAGANVPPGFLPCDGSSVSDIEHPTLASILSPWGSRTPDLRGRTIIGAGQGSGLTYRSVTSLGGEERHVLTVAEMPSHTHALGASGGNGTSGAYNITNGYSSNVVDDGYPVKGTARATGGGQAHNNMPPFAVIQYIIAF